VSAQASGHDRQARAQDQQGDITADGIEHGDDRVEAANWAWAAHRRAGTSSNKDMPTVIAPAPSRMLVGGIRPGQDEEPRIDSSIIGRVSLENRSTALDPRP
jgi:hypothetical protein